MVKLTSAICPKKQINKFIFVGEKRLTVNATGYRFNSISRKCNIISFLRFCVEAKRDVEFYHLTRNAYKIQRKVGSRGLNTRLPLSTLLCAGYSVKLKKYTKT